MVNIRTDGLGGIIVQDDTDFALDHAAQLRTAHEFPPMPIAVTIPGVATGYQIGDQISGIAGRDVSFQRNLAPTDSEAPSYPFVVAISWSFAGEQQSTVLQLSDRRLEPRDPNSYMQFQKNWWKRGDPGS